MTVSLQIETERLLIQPFTEAFLTPRYLGWLNDRDLVRYSEQRHREHTLESCRAYMESFEGTPHYFWALLLKKNGRHIGNLNAYVDPHNGVTDMGILIGAPEAAGQGLGKEAWAGAADYLFYEVGIRKLSAGCLSCNRAMMRLAQSVGMREDGRRQRHYLVDGEETDIVYWSVFQEEWKEF